MTTKPYPGAHDAIAAGCKCPIEDNMRLRRGATEEQLAQIEYWTNKRCPIHGGDK